jgi:hypothetical protein
VACQEFNFSPPRHSFDAALAPSGKIYVYSIPGGKVFEISEK